MSWFPITDPSREDDIRMRRRRALMLLSAIVFVPWIMYGDRGARHGRTVVVASGGREAESGEAVAVRPHREGGERQGAETQSFAAASLRIDLPCARSVSVMPDPSLVGRTVLSVPGGAQGALDAISISGGSVSQQAGCSDDSPVTIRTGNVVPLTLVQSGDNPLRVGSFDGAVTIEDTGSGTVSVEHAGTLTIADHDDGDVTVGSVTGPLTATMEGSGDLRVAGGIIPVLEVASHGSADLILDRVRALGGRAILDGSGDFRLGYASGTFEADTEGSGTVAIGRVEADHLSLRGSGSGDITIRDGRIATLQADRHGSGDLSIYAQVSSGRLSHDGTGTVRIPHGDGVVRTN